MSNHGATCITCRHFLSWHKRGQPCMPKARYHHLSENGRFYVMAAVSADGIVGVIHIDHEHLEQIRRAKDDVVAAAKRLVYGPGTLTANLMILARHTEALLELYDV